MRKVLHWLSCLTLLVFINTNLFGTHYIGGELTYSCLSGNQYQVKLSLYADCYGIAYGNSQNVNLSSACGGNITTSLNLLPGFPQDITPVCATSTTACTGGTIAGTNEYVYSAIVTLPANCNDWNLSWSTCCRSNAITNLAMANTQSVYISATLDNTLSVCNSAPTFIENIPQYICLNDTFNTALTATDVDGDSLVYSLISCNTSSTATTTYNVGFSGQAPFVGTTTLTNTGSLTIIPTQIQSGYICVQVEEYRNGNKVGQTMREMTITVQSCTNTLPKVSMINGNNATGGSYTLGTSINVPLNINVNTYDPEVSAGTQNLTATWKNIPSGATTTAGTSPSLAWTPTSAQIGTHYVVLSLSDDNCPLNGISSVVFQLVVAPSFTNTAPFAKDDLFTAYENLMIPFDVLLNDSDIDGDPLKVTQIFTLPSTGAATVNLNAAGTVDFTAPAIGTYKFQYEVCENTLTATPLCDTALVEIGVLPNGGIYADCNLLADTIFVFANNSAQNLDICLPVDLGLPNNYAFYNNHLYTGSFSNCYPGTTNSLISVPSSTNEIMITDIQTTCTETAVVQSIILSNDLINMTLAAGVTTDICLSTDSLSGNLISVTMLLDSLVNATINSIDLTTGCINITADSITFGQAVFVLCDDLGNCFTNVLNLTVELGVWPGDTDMNQGVDNFDALNIGLGYGQTGTARDFVSTLWDGHVVYDWTASTPATNVNYKHADCNGDGVVDAADTTAILANWGNSYNYNAKGGLGGILPLFVNTDTHIMNKNVQMPIELGTMIDPATNVYGLAFTIKYDKTLIKEGSVHITYDNSWLGTVNSNTIGFSKDFYDDGMIKTTLTRTDGMNESGFGQIGTLHYIIKDDALLNLPATDFVFEIQTVKLIDNQENETSVDAQLDTVSIGVSTAKFYLDNSIALYPNPVSSTLNIESVNYAIEQIRIVNVSGQEVKIINSLHTHLHSLDMSAIQNGVYIVLVQTNQGVVSRKITVVK